MYSNPILVLSLAMMTGLLVEGLAIPEERAPAKYYLGPTCCSGKGCKPYNNVDKCWLVGVDHI
jgi:hypothetical protein